MQSEMDSGKAQELMGVISHVACDNKQLGRQEKLIKYGKSHVIEKEQI